MHSVMYAIPPCGCSDRSKLWLILTAAHGLVNSIAKWQAESDQVLKSLGLCELKDVAQLFMNNHNDSFLYIFCRIVDDLLFTDPKEIRENLISSFNNILTIGAIFHSPGVLRFNGLNICQYYDFTIHIDGEDKLKAIETFPIPRLRQKDVELTLNKIIAIWYSMRKTT